MPKISGTGPVFRRLASDLKARIDAGEFRPGNKIPREEHLAASYGVSRVTVRRAIQVLEFDRILHVRHGHGTFVRLPVEPEVIDLVSGEKIMGRMPTLEEQEELEIPETTSVLVVVDPQGIGSVYPSDRVVLRCP